MRETLEALVGEGKIRGYGRGTDLLESASYFATMTRRAKVATHTAIPIAKSHQG